MSEDKRPKPSIDMKAEPGVRGAQKLELPNPSLGEKSARVPGVSGRERRRGGGFFSHVFAALIGGAVVAGVVYAITVGQIPGASLTDRDTLRQLHLLQDRTAELDRGFRAQRPASAVQTALPDAQNANEIGARLDAIADGSRGLNEAMQALSAKVADVDRRSGGGLQVSQLQAEVRSSVIREIGPLATKLAAIEQQVDTLSRSQADRQVDARSAALTLALTNLKRAIADGHPFGAELAAVDTLSSVKLPIAELASSKNNGIPTLLTLVREFEPASKKAIEKFYRSNASGFMGEVLSRAKAAIQVKPGDGSGSTIEAAIGRMEKALKDGDVRAALVEGSALEGDALNEMRAWIDRAQLRVSAEDALKRTDQELLAALTRPLTRR